MPKEFKPLIPEIVDIDAVNGVQYDKIDYSEDCCNSRR